MRERRLCDCFSACERAPGRDQTKPREPGSFCFPEGSTQLLRSYGLRVTRYARKRDTCGRVPAVSGVDGDGAGARAGRRATAAPRNPENETHAGGNDVNKAGTYERGRPRAPLVHITPQSRTGRVRRRRLYGVPTRRRAHRLTRETCGASASECVPCPDTPPHCARHHVPATEV